MDLIGKPDSADPSGSGSSIDRITDLLTKKICYELPTVPSSGESKYLAPLWVFRSDPSGSSQSTTTSLEPTRIVDKIRAALKLLSFRDPHTLFQFWSPRVVGRHQLLTTVDQPFGLGVVDEGFCLYRRESELNLIIVDRDHEEEDLSPPARVFRRGLPEWTSNLTNYQLKDFPQQECAISNSLCGYLALPLFDSTTKACVGVLELLTSSEHTDYAFEVKQVHIAMKEENLTTPQAFDCPTLNIPNEHRENEFVEILRILKVVCDTHNLPLAQTWAKSPLGSYVCHEKVIHKSCSSFNTRCIGKVCMSTAGLPFLVRDLSIWHFRESCTKQHLEKSLGFIGRALLSHGSCFCGDVTKLSEEEYPLVHNARRSGLTRCVSVYLHSVEGENDYVLEFFLPLDIKDDIYVPTLMRTLKQNTEAASGFELGDILSIDVVGPPTEVSNLSLNAELDTSIQMCSSIIADALTSEMDSEPIVANVATTDSPAYASSYANRSMQKKRDGFADAGETRNHLKRGIKRKINSLTLETVQQHFGRPLDEASKILRVSRSTLKRFCREHGIPRWPGSNNGKKPAIVTDSTLSQESWSERYRQPSFMDLPSLPSSSDRSETDASVMDLPSSDMVAQHTTNIQNLYRPPSFGDLSSSDMVAQHTTNIQNLYRRPSFGDLPSLPSSSDRSETDASVMGYESLWSDMESLVSDFEHSALSDSYSDMEFWL